MQYALFSKKSVILKTSKQLEIYGKYIHEANSFDIFQKQQFLGGE
jgi:hypothetical protein